MSVVIRLKVPIEIHYAVIPMETSKVNSSLICLSWNTAFTTLPAATVTDSTTAVRVSAIYSENVPCTTLIRTRRLC